MADPGGNAGLTFAAQEDAATASAADATYSASDGSPALSDPVPVTSRFTPDDEEDEEEYTPTLSPSKPEISGDAVGDTKIDSSAVKRSAQSPSDSHVSTHEMLSNPVKTEDAPSALANDQSVSNTVNADSPVPDLKSTYKSPSQPPQLPTPANVTSSSSSSSASMLKTRLPNDRVGILEDRIKDDPRGDIDAWLSLIEEHKKRNKLDEARATYDRFFKVFPSAAEQWVAYANMELENNDFFRVEQIFSKSLLNVPNVQLWSTYLNYVRRRNNLTTDPSGEARRVITEAYEFVLSNIGIDRDSGPLWQDYIQFIRSSPEQLGGTTWQDQQKMDTLRKVYQRAICVPTQAVTALWKEYDTFERSFNKQTGRKLLQEKSPAYISARSANTALQNLIENLNRNALPRMPPASGFDGEVEYQTQIDIWKSWIKWEKEDPLVLQSDDPAAFKARILYVYKQAVMPLRFWPEMWFDAAEFCFANGLENDGNEFLTQGVAANPESCLLAFKRADRIESSTPAEEGDANVIRRGAAVREPYDKLLNALYELIEKVKQRESRALARVDELFPGGSKEHLEQPRNVDEDEENLGPGFRKPDGSSDAKNAQLEALRQGFAAQLKLLSQTVSSVWIALMRAMGRVQGKGKLDEAIGGSRQIFADARRRSGITTDVFIASALMEHYRFKDPAANKIFERGMRLYPQDEHLALAFIKYLIMANDVTNARSVFETTVKRLTSSPALKPKAKLLFEYLHDFESKYGELSQVKKLEDRMQDLFPEDSALYQFSSRFSENDFNPTNVRLIVSPATQAKPKPSVAPLPLLNPSSQNSPRPSVPATTPQIPQIGLSPKRQVDESDADTSLPRKVPRSDSPLKGAAGRRLDAQKRSQLRNQTSANGSHSNTPSTSGPTPLPRELSRLLGMLPRAELYGASTTRFNPERIVELIRNVDLTQVSRATPQHQHPPVPQNYQQPSTYGYQPQNPNFGYGRQ